MICNLGFLKHWCDHYFSVKKYAIMALAIIIVLTGAALGIAYGIQWTSPVLISTTTPKPGNI